MVTALVYSSWEVVGIMVVITHRCKYGWENRMDLIDNQFYGSTDGLYHMLDFTMKILVIYMLVSFFFFFSKI